MESLSNNKMDFDSLPRKKEKKRFFLFHVIQYDYFNERVVVKCFPIILVRKRTAEQRRVEWVD